MIRLHLTASVVLALLLPLAVAAAPDFAALDIQSYEPPRAAPDFNLVTGLPGGVAFRQRAPS